MITLGKRKETFQEIFFNYQVILFFVDLFIILDIFFKETSADTPLAGAPLAGAPLADTPL